MKETEKTLAENPYVYVYEFTRLDPEEAQAKEAAKCVK
jgi:hypothetical protein